MVLYVSFHNHILLHTKDLYTYKFLIYQLTLFGKSVDILISWFVEADSAAAAAAAAAAALDIALVFVRVTLVCPGSAICSVGSSLTVCNLSNVVVHPRTGSQACGLSKTTISFNTKFCAQMVN
jgi:hypothetical protein